MGWNCSIYRQHRAVVRAADCGTVFRHRPLRSRTSPAFFALILACLALMARPWPSSSGEATGQDRFELRAILTVAGARHAMFADTGAGGRTYMLRSGEDEGDMQLVSLDPAQGTVVIRNRGRRHAMRMAASPGAASASPRGVIWLQNASIADITAIYQRITTRTVLRASALGEVSFSFREQNFDTPKASARLIQAFKEKEIELIPNGKRFAIAKKKGDIIPALPNYAQIIEAASDTSKKTSDSGLFQAGSINFPKLELAQFVDFYGKLTDRTILKPTALQSRPLSIVTQTDMNRWEAVYALDMTLALNGLKSTFLGDKFAAITGLNYDTGQVPEPPDPAPESKKVKAGGMKFMAAPATKAFQRYQELTESRVSPAANLPAVSIDLENRGEMAANEAAWAIEAILRLNGIHFQHTDENSVHATPLDQAPDAKN